MSATSCSSYAVHMLVVYMLLMTPTVLCLRCFDAKMETVQSQCLKLGCMRRPYLRPILLVIIEVNLSRSLRGLATMYLMWAHLRCTYEICNEVMYIAIDVEA
jgi:hypothetical protein